MTELPFATSSHRTAAGTAGFQVEVNSVIFSVDLEKNRVLVLLARHDRDESRDRWSLPAAAVAPRETLEATACRILRERVSARNIYLEQLYTFDEAADPLSQIDRNGSFTNPTESLADSAAGRNLDSGDRRLLVSYFALVRWEEAEIDGENAFGTAWYPLNQVPTLAGDRDRILHYGYKRLCNKLEYSPIAFDVLPQTFTLSEVYQLYAAVLGEDFSDYSNFRSRLLKLGFLSDTGQKVSRGAGRPASLYRFDARAFEPLRDKPMVFI